MSAKDVVTLALFDGGPFDDGRRRRLAYPPPATLRVPVLDTPSAWCVYQLVSSAEPKRGSSAALYRAQSP